MQTETAWTMTDAKELLSKKQQLAANGFVFIGLTVKHRSAVKQTNLLGSLDFGFWIGFWILD